VEPTLGSGPSFGREWMSWFVFLVPDRVRRRGTGSHGRETPVIRTGFDPPTSRIAPDSRRNGVDRWERCWWGWLRGAAGGSGSGRPEGLQGQERTGRIIGVDEDGGLACRRDGGGRDEGGGRRGHASAHRDGRTPEGARIVVGSRIVIRPLLLARIVGVGGVVGMVRAGVIMPALHVAGLRVLGTLPVRRQFDVDRDSAGGGVLHPGVAEGCHEPIAGMRQKAQEKEGTPHSTQSPESGSAAVFRKGEARHNTFPQARDVSQPLAAQRTSRRGRSDPLEAGRFRGARRLRHPSPV